MEPPEPRSESVGDKRGAGGGGEDGDLVMPPRKRGRGGGADGGGGGLRKVAEMVLVLAAMGKMRGGKGPTGAEKELMSEARSRLTEVCEGFAPKDVFPRDAFGGLIEDLGLTKIKEQRVGFRPPKVSIAEKLLLSKRKMEKAEDLSLPSTPHPSQRLQGNSGTAENAVKSARMPISAGNLPSASPIGHVATSNVTTPLPFQHSTSELRPVATALPANHLSSAAFPRADRTHIRADGRSNGSVYPSQVQVNHSANSASRTPTWSVHHQPAQPANASHNKVPVTMSLKVEGAVNVRPSQATSRTVIAQTTAPSSQGTNYGHPHVANPHAETAKIIQKLLQPRVLERPIWNPPSRDYMSKPLTCQMCMSSVTEIDNILICDACEKGYHLKCLQMTHQKGVQRGEWHCGKCLSLSQGKPLPPKYGRVMRNSGMTKVSTSSHVVSSTTNKRVDTSGDRVTLPNITVNGDTIPEKVPTGVAGNNSNHHQIPGFKREDFKEIQDNDKDLSGKMGAVASGTCPGNVIKTLSGIVTSMELASEKITDDKMIDMKPNSFAQSELAPNSSDEPQALVGTLHGNSTPLNDETSAPMKSLENNVVGNSGDTCADETSSSAQQLKLQDVLDNPPEIVPSIGAVDNGGSLSDGLPAAVNWVGDLTQALDDKIFYGSCCINGHVYKAMDHVLVRFEDGKIVPSKLQAMWEDKITSMKWVAVIRCYFPGDLPEAVGRPCGLENREVYESTKVRTLMAGMIRGPCEVLPPRNFEEEIENRTHTGSQLNNTLPPLYLCKWIYDEAKGLFRDISC